jgi:Right handed beta helix region
MTAVKPARCVIAAILSDAIRSKVCRSLCGVLLVLCTSGSPVYAQFIETFVASTGSDGNNCSTVPLACRTFGHALTQTFSGGQITVLDSADYGVASITGGISIINDSAGTATNALSANGFGGVSGMVYIDAGSSDTVTLRGLVLNAETFSGNPSFNGLLINNAQRVNIENCTILNAPGSGILVSPGVQPATLPPVINISIQNTTVNGNSAGVKVSSSLNVPLNITIAGSHIDNNAGGGVKVDGGGGGGPIAISILDSTISHNGGNGLNAVSNASNVMVNLLRDVFGFNGASGMQANGTSAAVVVNNTALLNNANGLAAINGGRILTYGNNSIVGTGGSSFTGTASLQ